jgi:HK97 family phage major capsid protein
VQGPFVDDLLDEINAELKQLNANAREGSTYVGVNASADAAADVARRKSAKTYRTAPRGGATNLSGGELLRAIKAARRGDPDAFRRIGAKAWTEGSDAAGGFLVPPEQLPGFLEARRASSPLRELCAHHSVTSNEVWIVTEGNTVTVSHVAEGATKPDTTGSLAQLTSVAFKVAATSTVSDELLDDSNGNAAEIVSRQFATQTGIEIDKAIIDGTGVGQPTGILRASGVTSTPVEGQTGQAVYASLVKAVNRLQVKFFAEGLTVVLHPRDAARFLLATDTGGAYLFPGGVEEVGRRIGANVVIDANVPTNRGAGTNESVIIVGAFREGAFFFERQPLTIDASSEAAWRTDETVFRSVTRYGLAVVRPSAFEVISELTA